MKYLEIRHPFFRPLWRRVAITGFCFGWAVMEFAIGSAFFGVLSGALGLFCAYQLFLRFDPEQFESPRQD